MRKILIIFLLGGCSFKPVADLRVSKEANHYQRDLTECRSLATEASSTLDKMITSVGYKRMVIKCLDGRGHSIINDI
jgi:hypothetical protein